MKDICNKNCDGQVIEFLSISNWNTEERPDVWLTGEPLTPNMNNPRITPLVELIKLIVKFSEPVLPDPTDHRTVPAIVPADGKPVIQNLNHLNGRTTGDSQVKRRGAVRYLAAPDWVWHRQ